ncbi:MAG: serine/threonine-protein kinase [Sorangiineae bacterium]|nr:serine/threonine-protein kinase [Polyangiaceae bacterium]MEB2323073.1 serine/threonine-protein kinase [Sorangiineae bacterium]
MTESPPRDLTGTVVAERYRVERLLGQGAMGSVWAGRHLSLEQLVAIKFLHPRLAGSREALRRFDTEAKAAARIRSRHAVTVHDHGVTADGQPYIVMECLEGESLGQAIERRGRLPLEEVAEIVSQAAKALDEAHAAGIVHRDLKPDNILLARDPEAGRLGYTVKLVDFGIAKLVHDEAATGAAATQAGAVLGTPHFMSPEALTASSPVTAASDVWSLGACAFAAVCGRVPFEGDAIGDVVLKVCAAPMPVPSASAPRVPRAFDAWFARSCAREPKQRFASAGEAARALRELERWAGAERERGTFELAPAAALDLELPEPRPSSRGVLLAGLLVGAAVTLGSLGALVYVRTEQANRAMAATAASANAAIEAANERKLAEADQAFWEAGAPEASAPTPPPRPPRQPSRVER